MKKYFFIKTPLAIFGIILITLSGCGSKEQPAEQDTSKPNAADMFKDDRPAYDATAIDANAAVNSITVSASGNTMAEMKYDQEVITVKSGTTIKLKLINTSKDASMPHNWVLVHDGKAEKVATDGINAGKEGSYVPDSKDVLIATKLLGPGEETEISFPAPPAGNYQFVCTYPGHWSIMNGKFIVE